MSASLQHPDELAQRLVSVGLEQVEESNRTRALAAAYLFALE